jgi:hypothetical protein
MEDCIISICITVVILYVLKGQCKHDYTYEIIKTGDITCDREVTGHYESYKKKCKKCGKVSHGVHKWS